MTSNGWGLDALRRKMQSNRDKTPQKKRKTTKSLESFSEGVYMYNGMDFTSASQADAQLQEMLYGKIKISETQKRLHIEMMKFTHKGWTFMTEYPVEPEKKPKPKKQPKLGKWEIT